MELKGKAVLITGAAVRLGRGLAAALAAQGCNLAIHCRHSRPEAEALARQLRQAGRRVAIIKSDLLKAGAGENLIQRAWRALGRLDALINNAAVFNKEPLLTSSEATLRATLEINLMAPVLLTRAFARMIGRGKIINLLDRRVAGVEAGLAGYLLSKQALFAFTRIAALELAPRITVNGVAPGPVLRAAGRKPRDPAGTIPLAKRPTPADIAEAVVFLLKSEAITGQIIFVDGGQHLLGNNR